MFKPENCKTLAEEVKESQIRLGIQGYFNTGKTWAALTFPNPTVLNIDRGLNAHEGRKDVINIKIYDDEYCKFIYPNYTKLSDKKHVILKWFEKNGSKLESDQTLVIDGLSGLQSIYHNWYTVNPLITKEGKVDDWGEYKQKIKFFDGLCEILKTLKCNVILVAHETDKKEKDGEYRGKIRPLLSGQFGDMIGREFTDWFRQHAITKPKDINNPDSSFLENFKMTKEEMTTLCKSYPRNTIYAWQTDGDDTFDGKASSLIDFPKFIPANYEHFKKWMRKI